MQSAKVTCASFAGLELPRWHEIEVENVERSVRASFRMAMREITGRFGVDEVLVLVGFEELYPICGGQWQLSKWVLRSRGWGWVESKPNCPQRHGPSGKFRHGRAWLIGTHPRAFGVRA